ncbi:cation diffusion facilitator family transporter [Dinoroseobacter sp. PD6]|uniref:Cobalt-zinc-cadmium efflux system protein n=1 Tax=Pseudooceanicola nitratireducens TaxID=517719 RepID=A0A1I1QN65_9RHOB|nr:MULTISPECIES: cation diffusion facilitator family transporter [Rhodobacterales]MDD9718585.1 cation diffusion facilitator family transporter [Dinoroseobacter sp. PD6]SEJ75131.1 cobalt-zinc-cadmium efflux system protein [Pseudooceanicola nitratireducens]SFD23432.1 cobalt-zinc-cadmium efflux system protein [Pseudooceanicola nitratireducens]
MATHSHAGHMPSSGKALVISAWLTGIYFVIELAVGLWTGSIAVLSDAFHTLSAVGGVLVAIIAQRIARRPADMARSYGWYRAEIIGALVNGGFLLGMALLVIWMGAMRLGNPIHLPTGPMLWVAFGGLVTEVISLGLMWKSSQDDLNARGALWHIIQTFVGSLLIIVTALVIEFTGFLAIDPILGMAFGVVLLWASIGVIREAVHILLEGTPEETDLSAVTADLRAQDGVLDVHHVHAWTLTSGKHAFSAHLRHAEPADAARILETAYTHLTKHHRFHMVTLQLETDCLDERHADDLDVTQSMGPQAELHEPPAHRDHLDSAAPDANLERNSKGNDT